MIYVVFVTDQNTKGYTNDYFNLALIKTRRVTQTIILIWQYNTLFQIYFVLLLLFVVVDLVGLLLRISLVQRSKSQLPNSVGNPL